MKTCWLRDYGESESLTLEGVKYELELVGVRVRDFGLTSYKEPRNI